MEKSAKVLDKLKNESILSEEEPDLEIISKEERVCLREMGLRISSSLVLGMKKSSFLQSLLNLFLILTMIVNPINEHLFL